MVRDTASEGDTPLWRVRHQPFGILCLIRGFSYSDVAKQKHRPAWLNTGLWPRLSFCGFVWGTAGGTQHFVRRREASGTQHFAGRQNSGWKARVTGEGATARRWRGHSTLLRGRSRAGKPELRCCYASWPGRVDRRTMRNRSAASRISTTATVATAKSSESDSASCLSPMRIQPPAKAQVA